MPIVSHLSTTCTSCGTPNVPCDDQVAGEPVCESCHHLFDFHRSCDPTDAPNLCPFCGRVLATHGDHVNARRLTVTEFARVVSELDLNGEYDDPMATLYGLVIRARRTVAASTEEACNDAVGAIIAAWDAFYDSEGDADMDDATRLVDQIRRMAEHTIIERSL